MTSAPLASGRPRGRSLFCAEAGSSGGSGGQAWRSACVEWLVPTGGSWFWWPPRCRWALPPAPRTRSLAACCWPSLACGPAGRSSACPSSPWREPSRRGRTIALARGPRGAWAWCLAPPTARTRRFPCAWCPSSWPAPGSRTSREALPAGRAWPCRSAPRSLTGWDAACRCATPRPRLPWWAWPPALPASSVRRLRPRSLPSRSWPRDAFATRRWRRLSRRPWWQAPPPARLAWQSSRWPWLRLPPSTPP